MIEYSIPKSAVDFTEEIKKSRFITYLRHTEGLAEAKAFWHEIKVLHPNARTGGNGRKTDVGGFTRKRIR